MPFHFCGDELLAIMMMLPFLGFFFKKIHTWYHIKIKHKCHTEGCDKIHADHNGDDNGI